MVTVYLKKFEFSDDEFKNFKGKKYRDLVKAIVPERVIILYENWIGCEEDIDFMRVGFYLHNGIPTIYFSQLPNGKIGCENKNYNFELNDIENSLYDGLM